MANKLTEKLAQRLEQTDASDLLEIVLELRDRNEFESVDPALPRGEKIAARKEAFSRDAAPVERAVREAGGEITGRAWINQTVRARVPAEKVRELSDREEVAALDLPRPIEPDRA